MHEGNLKREHHKRRKGEIKREINYKKEKKERNKRGLNYKDYSVPSTRQLELQANQLARFLQPGWRSFYTPASRKIQITIQINSLFQKQQQISDKLTLQNHKLRQRKTSYLTVTPNRSSELRRQGKAKMVKEKRKWERANEKGEMIKVVRGGKRIRRFAR